MAAVRLGSTNLVSDANLVYYWPEATDLVATVGGLDLTNTNITFVSNNGPFPDAASAVFNGSSAKATAVIGSMPVGTSARTIMFWFYTTSSSEQVMFNYGTNAVLQMIDIEVVDVGSGFRLFFNNGTGIDLQGTTTLSTSTWYHMAFTFATTTATFYLNGVEQQHNTQALNTNTGTGIREGVELAGTSTWFAGNMTDKAVFSRALGSTEVANYYNGLLPSSSAILSINGLAKASVSSVNGLAIASVKNWNGLA